MVTVGGETFRFYFDGEVLLHIQARHGTTPRDAIRTFFDGARSEWDEVHRRYESTTDSHGMYWTRHAHDGSILVISCWRRGVSDEQTTNN
jgi:hypothetical protein